MSAVICSTLVALASAARLESAGASGGTDFPGRSGMGGIRVEASFDGKFCSRLNSTFERARRQEAFVICWVAGAPMVAGGMSR